MNHTPYHAKCFAHVLTKRCSSDSAEKLAGAVASAQVDLNPHPVDAALARAGLRFRSASVWSRGWRSCGSHRDGCGHFWSECHRQLKNWRTLAV